MERIALSPHVHRTFIALPPHTRTRATAESPAGGTKGRRPFQIEPEALFQMVPDALRAFQ